MLIHTLKAEREIQKKTVKNRSEKSSAISSPTTISFKSEKLVLYQEKY